MDATQGSWPPGWYDDPQAPGRPRWWDGAQWHPVAPAPVPMGYGYGSGNQPIIDLAAEHRTGTTARRWLLIGVGGYAVYILSFVITAVGYVGFIRKMIDTPRGRQVQVELPASITLSGGIGQLGSLLVLAVMILFLMWFHRAATNARALGLPARHTPGWAIAGFFVPVINLWFPYQAACDLFPPNHPDRRLAGRWWACYLSAGFLFLGVLVGAVFSWMLALAVGLAVLALYFGAAVAARQMIERAGALHLELARQQAIVGPGFDPGQPDLPSPPALYVPPVPGGWAPPPEYRPPADGATGGGPWASP